MPRDDFGTEGVDVRSPQAVALDALDIPSGEQITVHMVHLNHLDLTWYWQLPDTIEMCLETIRWHVDLLEAHPDARYSHTQAFILHVVEQIDPALFGRFAKLVADGRVEIDSGQWVEPDHNLPSGESLVRQFLYGQHYIEDRFGIRARTLVNSDSFGHSRSLPQIMSQAGIGFMIFKRPRQRYVHLPETPFIWQGIDGTSMPALRFINKGAGLPSMSQGYDLPPETNQLQEKVDLNLAIGIHNLFASHCNADSGGVTPYVKPIERAGYSLRYSTPSEFFDAVVEEDRELPIVDGPLNFIYHGCYTTHIEEKEHCRRAERTLRELELLWTLAALHGHGYPGDAIDTLWRRLCFLQFHDILPGTGAPKSHADSGALYHELFLGANALRRRAQILLDRHVSGDGALRTFVVANPRSRRCHDIVAVDAELPIVRGAGGPCVAETGVLVGDDGNRVPYQIVDRRTFQRYVRGTMLFPASDVPALGMKAYRLTEGEPPASAVRAEGDAIENERLRVEVGGPGIVRSIVTKTDGRERLRSVDAPVRIELWPETHFIGDYGSPMQAWMLGITDARENAESAGGISVVENGPIRATLRVEHRWGGSRFTTDVSLYAGRDDVELRIECEWQEKETLCRLCVEPAVEGELRRTYGLQFGHDTASGEESEVPAIGWADISGEDGGIAVLNIDRAGHTFHDDCIRTSIVRCATGDHDPRTDSGTIRATLRLVPHAGSIADADIPRRSDEFTQPLTSWQSEAIGADLDRIGDLIRVEGSGIVLSGCKVTQRRDGYVIRLYESLGRPASGSLTLGDLLAGCSVTEANILEDEGTEIDLVDGRASLDFRAFEIKTIIVRSKEPIGQIDSSGLFMA